MHRLLLRQLKHSFGPSYELKSVTPEQIELLLQKVSASYDKYDTEHRHSEHIIGLNSDELREAKRKVDEKNEQLEEKVAKSVDVMRKQELIMFQQSKQASMGEMLSMIAHQWRQPLNAISAIASTLNIDASFNNYEKEFFIDRLKSINKLSQHLSSTIDDFRGFFKENKNKETTNLKELIHRSIMIIEPSLKTKNITLKLIIEGNDSISTYVNEVNQVIINLLKNAEDAFLDNKIPNPEILIRETVMNSMLVITIEDNAGGVPKHLLEKIFDPYFSTKTKKDGTGLGLYMSKIIIEDHCQGRLEVHNTKEGACFKITLPKLIQDKK